MAYPFKNNPTKKKKYPIQIKKNPPKLKLTHPTQIKLTLKSNQIIPKNIGLGHHLVHTLSVMH
jgi:hypothetical protein